MHFSPVVRDQWGPSEKNPALERTDKFVMTNHPSPAPQGFDDAIIARMVPPAVPGKMRRVYFVCAGRTARGTAAAGYFLANSWEKLYELYAKSDAKRNPALQSFAAIIRHSAQDYSQVTIVERADKTPAVEWRP